MSRVKLKLFGIYNRSVSSSIPAIQTQIDDWIEQNPRCQIIKSDTVVADNDIVITVKYYESTKRDVLLEKEMAEQEE